MQAQNTPTPDDYQQYLPLANQFLEQLFKEGWMTADDWQWFLRELEQQSQETPDTLARAFAVGVSNGYSVQRQQELLVVAARGEKPRPELLQPDIEVRS